MEPKEIVYDQIKEKCSINKGEVAASAANGALGGAVVGSKGGAQAAIAGAIVGGALAGTQQVISQLPTIGACAKKERDYYEKSKKALDKAARKIHKAHQAKEKAAHREMIIQYQQQRQQYNLSSAGRDYSMMSMLRNRSLA